MGVLFIRPFLQNNSNKIIIVLLTFIILIITSLTMILLKKEDTITGIKAKLKKNNYALLHYIVEKECILAADKYLPEKVIALVVEPASGNIAASCAVSKDSVGNIIFSNNSLIEASASKFEAGALIYPIAMTIAFEKKIIGIQDSIDCSSYQDSTIIIKDSDAHSFLTPSEIIKYSSNIGIAKLGDKLKYFNLAKEFRKFGLEYKHNNDCEFLNLWSTFCSPLEIVQAYSILANKGITKGNRRVVSLKNANYITHFLENVVNDGTGKNAKLNASGTAGKTHTFIIPGYMGEGVKYNSLFIGYTPLDNPQYLTFILLHHAQKEGSYSGLAAAPIFKNIMEGILHKN